MDNNSNCINNRRSKLLQKLNKIGAVYIMSSIINNIQRLKNLEDDLYNKLEIAIANNDNTNDLIKEIENVYETRVSLYDELTNSYLTDIKNVNKSRVDLADQYTVSNVIQGQIKTSKKRLKKIMERIGENKRMIEINNYFGSKYKNQAELVVLFLYMLVPILVLSILLKQELLPDNIVYVLMLAIVVVGGYYVLVKLWDILSRDTMNYDKYDWHWEYDTPSMTEPTNKKKAKASNSYMDELKSFAKELDINVGCIDEECCAKGTKYDKNKKKCI